MDIEEIAKIRKYVLRVNIHCVGCKNKVKKILRKIDGVYTTEIDLEQRTVTVIGNVDSSVIIKKLAKSRKHAKLWDAPQASNNNNKNNNQNNVVNQIKNMEINIGGKGDGGNIKGQQKGCSNTQPQGGQQASNPQHQQQQLLQQQQQQLLQQELQQQLQQLQQLKGLQDQNLPLQFKDMKLPYQQNLNQKGVKFNLPEDDECTDDGCDDDELDDEDYDDDEFDDESDNPHVPMNKMKEPPPSSNGIHMMQNGLMNGNQQQLVNALKNTNVEGNGKKGNNGDGGGLVSIQTLGIGIGNEGKKGGDGSNGKRIENNQNQSGGNKNNYGKNGGGMPEGKNGNNSKKNGSGANGSNPGNNNGNRGKMANSMIGGVQAMNPIGGHHPGMGRGIMGPIGNMNMPIGPMGNIPAVQGLPAATNVNSRGVTGLGGYFQGPGPEAMAGNPFQQQQQQQYMSAIMNQQRFVGIGSEQFQPMMYARPPPAFNHMYPQYPCPYPPSQDPYTHFFSDENTSSCSIM